MRKAVSLILILFLVLPPRTCFAWSEGGHHLIAVIAFSLLAEHERAELIAVLKQHPRFAEDFVPPESLPNEEERTRWLVGRAGYWPDVARRQPKYHRSTWHYELGPTIVLGNADGIEVPKRPGSLPLDATLESQDLYLSQAIELCRKVLSDKSQPAGDRAIALCWIGHLVADSHQPCHAGSLYMENVFVKKDGDRGANSIPTKQRQNMHALWDQLLGDEFALRTNRRRFTEITSSPQLTETLVKYQPQWIEAIYELLVHKKANIQLGFDVQFLYSCKAIRSAEAVELFADSWIAMAPILGLVVDG